MTCPPGGGRIVYWPPGPRPQAASIGDGNNMLLLKQTHYCHQRSMLPVRDRGEKGSVESIAYRSPANAGHQLW